jgi:DUF1016 N-terminal domain
VEDYQCTEAAIGDRIPLHGTAAFRCIQRLAEAWPDSAIVPQLVALLPWGHLRVLLDRLKDRETREWCLRAAVEYGWSRNSLVHQISSRLHEREGKPDEDVQ